MFAKIPDFLPLSNSV